MAASSWIPILLALAVWVQMYEAARRVDLEHHISKRSVHFRRSSPDYMLGLQEGEHLKPGNKIRTSKGTIKVKMQETYKGLSVVGEAVVLEMDEDGRYTGQVSGQLLEGIEEDIPSTRPALSPNDALEKALAYSGDDRSTVLFNPDKDAILQIEVQGRENVKPRLVYQLNYRIETRKTLKRPTFIIDANTGQLLRTWDAMTMAGWRSKAKRSPNSLPSYELVEGVGGNEKIGKYLFGLDLPELRVTVAPDGRCVLENQYAIVYNCDESYECEIDSIEPHHFPCDGGNNDTVNDAFSPLNDAFFYVGLTYEMYSEWYEQSDLLKNKKLNGGRCPTRVHYGEAYENAFWDGDKITFGDGADTMYPLASLNVVAHEISHGFTEMNGGLIYAGESGGMNEAFSDMAGEAAEDYLHHKIDWMVGFAIWKAKNESMRYFDSPPKDGHSIDKYDDFCFDMDPHSSSGVYNKVFYILSNKPGWCVRKAFHIFVVANDLYWKPDSDMHSGACDVQRAANDLGYNVNDVTLAFRAAGIEPCTKKHSNALGGPMQLQNASSMTFKLNNGYDDDLDYRELFILFYSQEPITLTIHTTAFKFTIEPTEDSFGGPGSSSPTINLGRLCFNHDCTITVSTEEENMAIVVPFVIMKTVMAGVDVLSDGEYPEGYNATGDICHAAPYTYSFEIPEVLLEKQMRILFVGKSQSRTSNAFFIRHAIPPNLDSYEYDLRGSLNGMPAMLCKARAGTYYLTIDQEYEKAESVSIQLGAWMIGEKQ